MKNNLNSKGYFVKLKFRKDKELKSDFYKLR